MSKCVSLYVSDESYEAALYLARMAHKDALWVMTQWLSFAKDQSLDNHAGLKLHIESWRAEQLREFQRLLVEPDDAVSEYPPF